jgi:hypothetical protein
VSASLDSPAIAGPLGSLWYSCVRPHASAAALRALKWHADLERLGVTLPFFVVHDVGLALVAAPDQLALAARGALEFGEHHRYRELCGWIRDSQTARRAEQLAMSDDLVAVVLAHVLGDVARAVSAEPSYQAEVPLDASLFDRLDGELERLSEALDRRFEEETLEALAREALLVIALVDALDVDTLRLFGIAGVTSHGALAQVELLETLATPEANDVVNLSLEILPSVLETKTRPGAASFAAFGYAGIGRRGSVDNMVLSELAWDDEELARRLLEDEVLYYAREQEREELGREHLLLIDASASMRGERSSFARAIALATGKKLLLGGEHVTYRFFDSRLYEPHGARGRDLPTSHLLAFKGERGRNARKVFQQLVDFLEVRRRPEALVVHLYTHAALYIPRDLVAAVRKRAQLAAVFILPSGGKLDLDYLDLLDAHWVVDHAALGHAERGDAARAILRGVEAGAASARNA